VQQVLKEKKALTVQQVPKANKGHKVFPGQTALTVQ
jgi:hypothetical protein